MTDESSDCPVFNSLSDRLTATFKNLRDDLVPLLCRRRSGNPRLKIWSAAASTGAELLLLRLRVIVEPVGRIRDDRRDRPLRSVTEPVEAVGYVKLGSANLEG